MTRTQPRTLDNQMDRDEVRALLDRCNEGVLSTVGRDGFPYAVPVNFVRVDDRIFFHGRDGGEKVGNIEACPNVCLTVMETGGFEITGPNSCNTSTIYESAVVRGVAEKVTDAGAKRKALEALVRKIVPDRVSDGMPQHSVDAVAVYAIDIRSATGKYRRPAPGNRRTG